jgi:hypothetical protein
LIRGEIIEYYKTKADIGKKRPKRISLECADVVPKKGKDLKISTGMQDCYIRFDTETQKIEWLEEIRKAQARALLAMKTEVKTKREGPITINEVRESSEEILVLSKHLEDLLKELYLEAELQK